MSTPKAEALRMIEKLADDVSWDRIAYLVLVRAKLDKAFAESDAGQDIPHEDVVRESEQWHKLVGPPPLSAISVPTTSESPVTR